MLKIELISLFSIKLNKYLLLDQDRYSLFSHRWFLWVIATVCVYSSCKLHKCIVPRHDYNTAKITVHILSCSFADTSQNDRVHLCWQILVVLLQDTHLLKGISDHTL